MGLTIAQKIIKAHLLEGDMTPGSEIALRIEGMAAAYAAERMTPDDKKKLREAVDLQEFYVGRSDADHVQWQDHEFHETIYAGCGSVTLQSTLVPLHRKAQKYRRASVENKARAARSVEEHRLICEAIEAGDAKLAEERMVAHIENARKSMLDEG